MAGSGDLSTSKDNLGNEAFFGEEPPDVQPEGDGSQGNEPLPNVETEGDGDEGTQDEVEKIPVEGEVEEGEKELTPEQKAETDKEIPPKPGETPKEKQTRQVSWNTFKRTERLLKEAQEREAARTSTDEQTKKELDELRNWRIQQEANERARQELLSQQPQQPIAEIPGQTRPFTEAELQWLKENDITQYNTYIAENNRQLLLRQEANQRDFEVRTMIQNQINDFKGRQTDYVPAVQHLEMKEKKRWLALGYNEDQAQQFTLFRAAQVIRAVMDQKGNVAEKLYALALEDGWVVPSAETTPTTTKQPTKTTTAKDKVLNSQRQSAVERTSLTSVPSSSGGGTKSISQAEFKAMSEADMEAMEEEYGPNWIDMVQPG